MGAAENWKIFARNHRRGEVITGPVSKITDFGLFVDLEPDIFGIVHLNDLDWDDQGMEALEKYKVGHPLHQNWILRQLNMSRVVIRHRELHG